MDPLKAAVAVGKTGNGLKACFPGASRSVWHSFHSWRAWSRLSKEPRARQTRQKERVKDSVAVSVILSLRHIHSSRFSFYIYVSTYNKYIHIQLYIYICSRACARCSSSSVKAISLVQCPPLFERALDTPLFYTHTSVSTHTRARLRTEDRPERVLEASGCGVVGQNGAKISTVKNKVNSIDNLSFKASNNCS